MWLSIGFRTSTMKMYWWFKYIDCIMLICSQWSMHKALNGLLVFIMLVNLSFNSSFIVRIVLIWICMTISPQYRVDDEAQQERQRPQIKVHYTKSSMIILLNFLHDAFLMVLLISLNLLCSLGRIHSIVCDHREMKPDFSMEWRRPTRHLLRVRISSQFILKLIFVHSRGYDTL